jgi:hypothetical protein
MQPLQVFEVSHMEGEIHQVSSTKTGVWQLGPIGQTALSSPV